MFEEHVSFDGLTTINEDAMSFFFLLVSTALRHFKIFEFRLPRLLGLRNSKEVGDVLFQRKVKAVEVFPSRESG